MYFQLLTKQLPLLRVIYRLAIIFMKNKYNNNKKKKQKKTTAPEFDQTFASSVVSKFLQDRETIKKIYIKTNKQTT